MSSATLDLRGLQDAKTKKACVRTGTLNELKEETETSLLGVLPRKRKLLGPFFLGGGGGALFSREAPQF